MAISPPRIFVSYSPSKSLDPRALGQFTAIVKERLLARHWEVVDPMVSTDVEQISRKLHEAIFTSDAMIAECTTGAPNVMYEIGAMRGLGRTVILAIDPEPVTSDEERKKHLAFYGLSGAQPLASDLGDIEYLRYRDLMQAENRQALCAKLDEVLDKLANTKLIWHPIVTTTILFVSSNSAALRRCLSTKPSSPRVCGRVAERSS